MHTSQDRPNLDKILGIALQQTSNVINLIVQSLLIALPTRRHAMPSYLFVVNAGCIDAVACDVETGFLDLAAPIQVESFSEAQWASRAIIVETMSFRTCNHIRRPVILLKKSSFDCTPW